MPFGLVVTPSLALGLLQAALSALPLRTQQLYFSLRFAQALGFESYRRISERWEIGDWIFASALFPDHDLDGDGFVENVIRNPPSEYRPVLSSLPEKVVNDLIEKSVTAAVAARDLVAEFLEQCQLELQQRRPRLVGFACLFQQRLASLALARLLKQRLPETFVLFGGPECHEQKGVEILRQFDFVDAVVSGPGDLVFPEIVRRVIRDEPINGIRGVYTQKARSLADTPALANAQSPADLDELPYPLFDDYFAQLDQTAQVDRVPAQSQSQPAGIYISLETSRGCWWGERPKRHCVFCGLNGARICYSAKSSPRVVQELEFFAHKYPGKPLIMTDSILDRGHLKDAIPALAASDENLAIQYETRATLTEEQLRRLRAAGVIQIQPGIESLSTPVLRLMRKGTDALQNIQLLKWSRELGLRVLWNLLAGVPAEPPEAYTAMANLIPLLAHLPPPQRFRYISLVRHSPLFAQAVASAVTVDPAPAYSYIFPFAADVIANLATSFSSGDQVHENIDRYTGGVQQQVRTWQRSHATSNLVVVDTPGDSAGSLIVDRRPIAKQRFVTLRGLEHFLHWACSAIKSLRVLHRMALGAGFEVPEATVKQALDGLVTGWLLVEENDRYLSLALRATGPDRPDGAAVTDGGPRP